MQKLLRTIGIRPRGETCEGSVPLAEAVEWEEALHRRVRSCVGACALEGDWTESRASEANACCRNEPLGRIAEKMKRMYYPVYMRRDGRRVYSFQSWRLEIGDWRLLGDKIWISHMSALGFHFLRVSRGRSLVHAPAVFEHRTSCLPTRPSTRTFLNIRHTTPAHSHTPPRWQ